MRQNQADATMTQVEISGCNLRLSSKIRQTNNTIYCALWPSIALLMLVARTYKHLQMLDYTNSVLDSL